MGAEKCKENCVHKYPLLSVDDKNKIKKVSNERQISILKAIINPILVQMDKY